MLLYISCIGRHIILSLSDVTKTLVLFKMAEVNAGYLKIKLDLLTGCKKKNPTCVGGKERQIVMPSSDPQDRIVYPIHKLMIDSYILQTESRLSGCQIIAWLSTWSVFIWPFTHWLFYPDADIGYSTCDHSENKMGLQVKLA